MSCLSNFGFGPGKGYVSAVLVKTLSGSSGDSMTWGNLTGATTVLRLDSKLIRNDALRDGDSDIRKFRIHETQGPPIILRAPSTWPGGDATDGDVAFYATYGQAVVLAERSVMLVGPDGVVYIPFAFVEAAANLLTNPALDPFGKIPEFKYCAAKLEPLVPARVAAE